MSKRLPPQAYSQHGSETLKQWLLTACFNLFALLLYVCGGYFLEMLSAEQQLEQFSGGEAVGRAVFIIMKTEP